MSARHHGPVDMRRAPGESRYARLEREQRWVLPRLPDGLADPTSIVDIYLDGTRLRLRTVTTGSAVVYKLGQKVRLDENSPERVKLTNIYLSEPEHARLLRLPGRKLRKTRWRHPGLPRTVVVDEFHGHVAGLVLAETELDPGEDPWTLPIAGAADVTADDRFSGGALARLTAEQVTDLFATVRHLLRT
jgi:CYTH domain-containing protein